ncbi:MAG: hypothetical protein V1821_00390 [bacterium]
MKHAKALIGSLALMFGLTFTSSAVQAADFRAPSNGSDSVTVGKSEVITNLYTAGAMVTISGDILKSLHVGGGTIMINGNVGGSVYAGGGTVMLRGDVGGSAHLGGGNIIVDSKITDDLFVGGGNIAISDSATIGGDLIIGGGSVTIDGAVSGNLIIGGGQVTLNGEIGGSVKGEVDSLSLGASAKIGRDLDYKASKEASIASGAQVLGTTTFGLLTSDIRGVRTGRSLPSGALVIALLVKFLISITTGLVLVYLFRKITEPIIKQSLTSFWSSLGLGFAGLILTPILAVILAITIIGLGLAGIMGTAYVVLLIAAKALTYIVFGSWLIKLITKQKNYTARWQEVVVGALVLGAIGTIPYLGWLVVLIFMLIGLGALYQLIYRSLWKKS